MCYYTPWNSGSSSICSQNTFSGSKLTCSQNTFSGSSSTCSQNIFSGSKLTCSQNTFSGSSSTCSQNIFSGSKLTCNQNTFSGSSNTCSQNIFTKINTFKRYNEPNRERRLRWRYMQDKECSGHSQLVDPFTSHVKYKNKTILYSVSP